MSAVSNEQWCDVEAALELVQNVMKRYSLLIMHQLHPPHFSGENPGETARETFLELQCVMEALYIPIKSKLEEIENQFEDQ